MFKNDEYQQVFSQSVTPELHPRTNRIIRKPEWLKSSLVQGETLFQIKQNLRENRLYTVCEEAKCPNISDCWNAGTATFMIMGDVCTRGCRFCHIKTGNPNGWLDLEEPFKVAHSIQAMNLDFAVITMVDRDDLPDGGAEHIGKTIEAIQKANPKTRIEILAGDFRGQTASLHPILYAGRGLDVFAHNVETVRRLSPRVRDARAKYDQSLHILAHAKKSGPASLVTKSAVMLGLGEEGEEVYATLQDLRQVGVDIITIGQYLQPTPKHLSVKRFVHPSEFDFWSEAAKRLGFRGVASGPLVRSSYKANHLFLGQN